MTTCRCGKEEDGLGFTEEGTCITRCDRCRDENLEREENEDDKKAKVRNEGYK